MGTPQMDAAKAEGLSVDRIAGNFGAEAAGQGSDLLHKDSNVAMIKEIFLVQSAEGARALVPALLRRPGVRLRPEWFGRTCGRLVGDPGRYAGRKR
eukprot:COSAG02_NODE_3760_length_6272_cov_13.055565_6_plen_96_part_00